MLLTSAGGPRPGQRHPTRAVIVELPHQNATIEAARAGEVGKAFAVVANEVKELAKGTAKATEDISQKIEGIQTDTKGAVEAMGEISQVITQNDISNTIASAVGTTTSQIARNVAEAARGGQQVAENIAAGGDGGEEHDAKGRRHTNDGGRFGAHGGSPEATNSRRLTWEMA